MSMAVLDRIMNHYTTKEAAAHYKVSTKTISRWAKEGKLKFEKQGNRVMYSVPTPQEELNAMSALMKLPPGGTSQLSIVPQVQQFTGIFQGGQRFYLNPDEAIRASRTNARAMLRSLAIRGPLQERTLAVAELPWHIEPENKRDAYQSHVATELTKIVEAIPDFLKYRRQLLWAMWFGCSACQNLYYWNWEKDYKRLMVKDWQSVHGDVLEWKFDSDAIGVLVGVSFGGATPGTRHLTTEPTDVSWAHVLDEGPEYETYPDGRQVKRLRLHEREAFVVHRHDLDAGDFFEPEAAGAARRGLGIRSVVYWTYFVCQQMLGWLTDLMERTGQGIWLYKFQRNNDQSYNAMVQLAQSQSSQLIQFIPVDIENGKMVEGVEYIEPNSAGLHNLMEVIDGYYNAQIRRYITGQDATSRPVPSGMNSGVAEAHQLTFSHLVKYDAINLQETLTRELVHVIQRWTFPEANFKCKFVISTDKPNPLEYLRAVREFIAAGGTVDEDEVRSVLGFSRPTADAAVLGGKNHNSISPDLSQTGDLAGQEEHGEEAEVKEDQDVEEWQDFAGPRGGIGQKKPSNGGREI